MADLRRIPDGSLVVRCGKPPYDRPPNLRARCKVRADNGLYGFSVQSALGVPLEVLASWCQNRRVGVLTIEEVRALGYDVFETPGPGRHATVVVPGDWSESDAEALAKAFCDVENPAPGAKQ